MSKKKRSSQQKKAKASSQRTSRQFKNIARGGKPSAEQMAAHATHLWDQHLFDKALIEFKRAHEANPNHLDIHLDLARAYLLRNKKLQAERIFTQLLKKTDRNLITLLRIGESYRKIPRYDLAISYFKEAIVQPKAPLSAYLDYMDCLERNHELDKVREVLDQVKGLADGNPLVLLQEAKVLTREKKTDEAQMVLEKLTKRLDCPPDTQWMSRYELAKLYNLKGRYDLAMSTWLEAKELLQVEAQVSRRGFEHVNSENQRSLDDLSAVHFEAWKTRGVDLSDVPPMCVITSHPRSGTTLLEQILDSHEQAICMDEHPIFGDDVGTKIRIEAPDTISIPEALDGLSIKQINQYRKRYLKSSESAIGEKIQDRLFVDKNPALTMQIPAMCAIFPDIKILFPVRDPRDVVISCFMQKLHMNSVSVAYLDLKTACEQYARIMDTWLTLRPMLKNPWLEMRYEDLVGNPEKEARRVLEFLDLPWDESVLEYHKRAQTKFVSSPTYSDVTKKIYKGAMGRWKNYEKYLEPHLSILQPYVEAFGYGE